MSAGSGASAAPGVRAVAVGSAEPWPAGCAIAVPADPQMEDRLVGRLTPRGLAYLALAAAGVALGVLTPPAPARLTGAAVLSLLGLLGALCRPGGRALDAWAVPIAGYVHRRHQAGSRSAWSGGSEQAPGVARHRSLATHRGPRLVAALACLIASVAIGRASVTPVRPAGHAAGAGARVHAGARTGPHGAAGLADRGAHAATAPGRSGHGTHPARGGGAATGDGGATSGGATGGGTATGGGSAVNGGIPPALLAQLEQLLQGALSAGSAPPEVRGSAGNRR